MKKLSIIFPLVATLTLVTACKDKQPQSLEDRIEEFRNDLTAEDTTTMLRLCDEMMEQLKQQQLDQVLGSLYEYDDSTREARPLSEQTARRYSRKFKMFPVQQYTRKYYSFMHEGCNDVKYEVVFATAEQAGTDEPATTMYMFNPVKIGDEWKICVKTAKDEHDSEFE